MPCPYALLTTAQMIKMARSSGQSIAEMQRSNELVNRSAAELDASLDRIWSTMNGCIERGLAGEGVLPGGLKVSRRARRIHRALLAERDGTAPSAGAPHTSVVDWLLAYAMAVNEVRGHEGGSETATCQA